MNPARILAFAILCIAAVGAARVVAQQPAGIATLQGSATDPLAKELERCRLLNDPPSLTRTAFDAANDDHPT